MSFSDVRGGSIVAGDDQCISLAYLMTLLPTGEASRRAGVSSEWLRIKAKRGELKSIATPLGLLFDPDAVDAIRRRP